MNYFSDERAAELRQLFFETAQELLQALNEDGLELEKRPGDAEIIRRVRRAVHTLKGDSAACGFREMSQLAHELEDAFTPELAEQGDGTLAEVVFAAADAFHAMLTAYRNDLQPPAGDTLRARIRRLVQRPDATDASQPEVRTAPSPEASFAWSEYEQMMIAEAIRRGEAVYNIALTIDPHCPMRAAALQLVRNVLHSSGTILALRPDDTTLPEDVHRIEAALACQQTQEWIASKSKIPAVVTSVIIEKAVPSEAAELELAELLSRAENGRAAIPPAQGELTPAPDAPARVTPRPGKTAPVPGGIAHVHSPEDSLRVDAERIDAVLNMVGELIIGKSMLFRTIEEFERRFTRDPLRGKFADAMAFQSRVLDELHKSVMKIRMVPVEQLFRRFPRIVRDVAKMSRKDVALAITGQSTDLDKSILDALAEPLTHLVRNAVDHGIEPPEERVATGKPARGTVRLAAQHQGNQVVIEIHDDGHGLDHKKIIARALERGLITAEEAARLTPNESLNLIFHAGLSTAERITEISGRGVGMDVVKSVLERLKGTVTIESKPGEGSTFRLMVPLTLASMKALLFQVGDQLYAVPLAAVREITRITEDAIHRVDNHEVFQLRDQVLTLVRLNRLAQDPQGVAAKRMFAIVVSIGDRRFGLAVDKLAGEEELVIKALDNQIVSNELVSGASILGDGTVVLILNAAAVIAKLAKAEPVGATA